MKFTQKLSVLIILFILLSNTLPAQDFSKPFELKLTYSHQTTGKYYDYNKKSHIKLVDSLYSPILDTVSIKTDSTKLVVDTTGWNARDYTFTYTKHTIQLDFSYNPNKYVKILATLPLSFYSLNEKWGILEVQNGSQSYYIDAQPKADYNLTKIDYFGLDCEAYAFNDKFILGLRGAVYIPFGGEKSVQNTLEYPFLSDGYLDVRSGPILGFRHKNIRFTTEVLYDYRGEEPIDDILINSTFAFSTVENTELRIKLLYAKSLEDYKPEDKFTTTRENIWEEYLDIGFEVKMKFTENFCGYGGYKLRFYNRNTWSIGMFWLTGSYIF